MIGKTRLDTCRLGIAKRGDTNQLMVRATQPYGTDDPDFFGDYGRVDLFGTLGVAGMPYPPSQNGDSVEGIIAEDVAGTTGIVIAARDERTADVTGQLQPGETCVHSTGPAFDSRLFLKKGAASLVAGNSAIANLTTDAFRVAAGGSSYSMDGDGHTLTAPGGQSFVSITPDVIWLCAPTVLIGPTPSPAALVNVGPTPGAPSSCIQGSL